MWSESGWTFLTVHSHQLLFILTGSINVVLNTAVVLLYTAGDSPLCRLCQCVRASDGHGARTVPFVPTRTWYVVAVYGTCTVVQYRTVRLKIIIPYSNTIRILSVFCILHSRYLTFCILSIIISIIRVHAMNSWYSTSTAVRYTRNSGSRASCKLGRWLRSPASDQSRERPVHVQYHVPLLYRYGSLSNKGIKQLLQQQ